MPHQMAVPDLDEPAKVAGQHQLLHENPHRAQVRLELDPVDHDGTGPSWLNSRTWLKRRNGPRICSSTKRSGHCICVIRLVIVNGTPKCLARHVTSSPDEMRTEVIPPIASSRELAMEARWASMLRAKSKSSACGMAVRVVHSK